LNAKVFTNHRTRRIEQGMRDSRAAATRVKRKESVQSGGSAPVRAHQEFRPQSHGPRSSCFKCRGTSFVPLWYSHTDHFPRRMDEVIKQTSENSGQPNAKIEQPTVKSSGGIVEITCPPGTYMNGISFRIDKGGPHGIVSDVSPKFQPLPTSGQKKP
jgi:hypothetical protein